jgi:ABC-type transporter Mla subunit MlaD
MSIKIVPDHLKGMTNGQLREIRQHGFAPSAGVFTEPFIKSLSTLRDANAYFRPREPLGVFMSALEQAKTETDEMTEAIIRARRAMVDHATEAQVQLTEASRKMRDGTEKLGAAIQKFSNICGTTDFVEKAKAAESLANSLERLAHLDQNGMLGRVIEALQKK